jgi:hypothetical protein
MKREKWPQPKTWDEGIQQNMEYYLYKKARIIIPV